MAARSGRLFAGTSAFGGTLAVVVPAGQVWILKSVYVRNTTGGLLTPRVYVSAPPNPTIVDLLLAGLAAGVTERWDGLIVLAAADSFNFQGTATGVHCWASGSVLVA
jgi:hypothetical protein